MKKVLSLIAISLFAFTATGSAQPLATEKKQDTKTGQKIVARTQAPNSFEAKYEGGMFGYSKREKGTLKFEDANERIVFYGKDQKEKFSIPYKAIVVIYPNSRSQRSTTGTIVSAIPLPGAGIAGLFIREKLRYLIINFHDPQVNASGTANFKLANKELLGSVIQTLGEKAQMTQRGDAYYRPKDTSKNEQ
ncbi:MAG: hypothetical protein LC768_17550 [Acidobacteria bacterium]|nr:hypothetical protein [Acidobacteriota bacterium]MCA1640099.1 hypothetical protein [Acidobacteriota bacterium]